MPETPRQAQPEISAPAQPPELPDKPAPTATAPLDIGKARANLDKPDFWAREDINPSDSYMSGEEYDSCIENIVVSVKFLKDATVDGVNFASNIRVDQNQIDPKLIDLQITIPSDEFTADGVYGVSAVKKALSVISNSLPLGAKEDPDQKVRLGAEKALASENLTEKLKGAKETDNKAASAERGELVREFREQASPKHTERSGYKKFTDALAHLLR